MIKVKDLEEKFDINVLNLKLSSSFCFYYQSFCLIEWQLC